MNRILSGAEEARNKMIERKKKNSETYVTPQKAYEALTIDKNASKSAADARKRMIERMEKRSLDTDPDKSKSRARRYPNTDSGEDSLFLAAKRDVHEALERKNRRQSFESGSAKAARAAMIERMQK